VRGQGFVIATHDAWMAPNTTYTHQRAVSRAVLSDEENHYLALLVQSGSGQLALPACAQALHAGRRRISRRKVVTRSASHAAFARSDLQPS
jgi:predicted ribonuclease YlaK